MATTFDTASAEPIGLINLSSGNSAFTVLPFCVCFHIFHAVNHIFSPAALFVLSFGLVGRTVIFSLEHSSFALGHFTRVLYTEFMINSLV